MQRHRVIAVATVEGERCLVGIECKARVTPATQNRERAQAELLSRFQTTASSTSTSTTSIFCSSATSTTSTSYTGSSRELYTIVDAASRDFHSYVDSAHEAVQLLHQAYVCNFRYVLLLVGETRGNIIRGACSKFSNINIATLR